MFLGPVLALGVAGELSGLTGQKASLALACRPKEGKRRSVENIFWRVFLWCNVWPRGAAR